MSVRDVVQAAAGALGGEALYVDDVFSTYLYTGTGSTQAINNGIALGNGYDTNVLMHMEDATNETGPSAINSGVTFSSTQAKFGSKSAYFDTSNASLQVYGGSYTGDLTIECWAWAQDWSSNANNVLFGPWTGTILLRIPSGTSAAFYISDSGTKTGSASVSLAAQTWHHYALTRDGSTWRLYINGTQVATATSGNTTIDLSGLVIGSETTTGSSGDSWYGYIDELRVSPVCHYPDGTSFTPSTSAFSATVETEGQGGMVWIKDRDSGAKGHALFDTERGGDYKLQSQSTNAQFYATNQITSFKADGFILGSAGDPNGSGTKYTSWTFRKAPKFFDVVTWTGNGASTRAIPHSLGSTPGFIQTKRSNGVDPWWNHHRSVTSPNANWWRNYGRLESSNTFDDWGDNSALSQAPDENNFYVGSYYNATSVTYVAYLFAHEDGGFGADGTEDVISCGSFTKSSGVVYTETLGYEPQWLLFKRTDAAENWFMIDNMRGMTVGGTDAYLIPNLSNAESNLDFVTPTATGFEATNNFNNGTYIYIAIRRGPMKTPESGTEVFAPVTYAGTGTTQNITTGFANDMEIIRRRDSAENNVLEDKLRGSEVLFTNTSSGGLASTGDVTGYLNTGFTLGASNQGSTNDSGSAPYISWNFKRAPGFFDVVAYTGNGSVRTINHSLGVAPEMFIVKDRSASWTDDWRTYHKDLTSAAYYLKLHATSAETVGNTTWNQTAPTDSVFTIGSGATVNTSGDNYIVYLFATLAGVSKVGSYTGTTSDINVDCGFSAGARFVLIKRTDSTGDWYVWDSARGIVAGNDPYLLLNSTAAEVTSTDYIDPYSAGFTVTSTAPAALNASGGTYIFLAIA